MKRSLYLECQTGISGDMTVASLLDLCVNLGGNYSVSIEKLEKVWGRLQNILKKHNFTIHHGKVIKGGFSGYDFEVHLGAGHEEHHREHSQNHHHHEHNHLNNIYEIIDNAKISLRSTELSKKIFHIVAEAEAIAHGTEPDKIHFHEVGAIDSIVDIISTAVLVSELEIDDVIIQRLNEGNGIVVCQHGVLPVPVPAVLNIVSKHRIPLNIIDVDTELVTPTGAAICAALRSTITLPKGFIIDKVGIGFGKKDIGRPNLLRAMLITQ
jgi:uncharacterized protein (DUF111 family)